MSNVIKAYTVRYGEEEKKTIDTHLRIDKEIEQRRKLIKQETAESGEFVEGLKALVIDTIPSPEELNEKSSQILDDAREEADSIVENARKEAEQLKKEAYAAGQKKGYEDGLQQGKKETQKLKADYEEMLNRLQIEHDEMASALEPQMAEIIASLVEKITGIMIEDRDEVIRYLVEKAIKNLDKCNEYTIHVSKEDFEYISMRKNLLLGAIGREVPLYILEDPNLLKNQCLIETDVKAINCSLDIQLNNLITDLKLIGGI